MRVIFIEERSDTSVVIENGVGMWMTGGQKALKNIGMWMMAVSCG